MDGRAKLLNKIAGFAPPPPSPMTPPAEDPPPPPFFSLPVGDESTPPVAGEESTPPAVGEESTPADDETSPAPSSGTGSATADATATAATADATATASPDVDSSEPTTTSADGENGTLDDEHAESRPSPEDTTKHCPAASGDGPDDESCSPRSKVPRAQTKPSRPSGTAKLLNMLGGFAAPPSPPHEEQRPATLDRAISVAALDLNRSKRVAPPARTSHEAPEAGPSFFRSSKPLIAPSTKASFGGDAAGERSRGNGRDRPVSMSLGLARATSLQSQLRKTDDAWVKNFLASLKKYSGSNKQLAVVAKYCTTNLSMVGKKGSRRKKKDKKAAEASMKLIAQLERAREALFSSNNDLSGLITGATRTPGNEGIGPLFPILGMVASTSSFLVNCMRTVVLEDSSNNTNIQKQVLTASRTVRDSLNSVLELVAIAPLEFKNVSVEKQVGSSVRTVKQSISQLVMAQAAVTGGKLIPDWRRHEILGAGVAAITASTKMCWIRDAFTPAKGELVVEGAKVVGTTISQLCASITDGANSDIMVAVPDYQQALLGLIDPLKSKLQEFIDETKKLLGFDDMNQTEAYVALRDEIINALSWVDMMAQLSITKIDGSKTCPKPTDDSKEKTKTFLLSSVPEAPPQAPEEEKKKRGRTLVSKGADINVWEHCADTEEHILFADDGSVKAATLNKLIEKVTAPDSPDSVRMMKTFIATYESFTTPYELITKLKERFVVPSDRASEELPVQLRVCNVLRAWVETNFKDFSEDDIEDLLSFVGTITEVPRMKLYGEGLQRYIQKNRSSAVDAVRRQLVELKLEPKIPLSPARFLNVFDEAEVARQLTLVEHGMYKAIKPVELINQAWSKEGLKHRAPNVRAMIKRSTALSFWVASCILWQPTLKERARVMTKIVNIGEHLRKLNNFNSIMALISGINLSAIHRLMHTRSELSGSTLKTFRELEGLMSSDSSFSKYRHHVNNCDPPCVPFLGVYLTDLTFSDDGSADKIGDLINFGKRSRIYHMIEEILKFQNISYDFEYVDHIASFLTELPQNSDGDLYDLSRKLEPKGSDKGSIL